MIEVQEKSLSVAENSQMTEAIFDVLMNFSRAPNEQNLSDLDLKLPDEDEEELKTEEEISFKSRDIHSLWIGSEV